jgi:phage-related baseplate assembly protein
MSKLKKTPINYTSRDYDSIKKDLLNHAKRYYSDEWKDFSKSTINSLMLDTVAYVGDVLSYYVDYSVNESFLDTALEFNNIRKHARAMGYKFAGNPNAYGIISMFCLVPSNGDGTAPDFAYMPTIKQGSSFGAASSTYTLTEDVRFDDPKNEIVAARFDPSTGATTFFAVKAFGQVVSGVFQRVDVDLTNSIFKKFRKVRVGGSLISEIISVKDSDGNNYYEVENLSQEVVFQETTNKDALSDGVRSIMKPYVAARRFVLEQDDTGTYLQFGFGSEDDGVDEIADPSQVAIKMFGKKSISKMSFDPSKLLQTNKLGVAPSGTNLTIIVKSNDNLNVNAAVNTITSVQSVKMEFDNTQTLSSISKADVLSSLEVTNEEPIVGDIEELTSEELKQRAKSFYASQNRAVTRQDYESMIYNMPKKFGIIKRASVVNDPSATNRRIALYVISEDAQGKLSTCNAKIKSNLKTWIMQYKSLNDVIDIYDAKVVNFGIDFKVTVDHRYSQFDIVGRCVSRLKEYYSNQLYIGEPVYISRLYSVLGKVEGVSDVKKVTVNQKFGGAYSSTRINFDDALSKDGTYINTPKNVIMELKYPNNDIKGTLIK